MYLLGQTSCDELPGLGSQGLGCADCGGTCAGAVGLGVFDGGLDWNSWGWQEWGVIFLGAYAVGSMVFTGRSGVREVQRYAGRKRRARRMREQLS